MTKFFDSAREKRRQAMMAEVETIRAQISRKEEENDVLREFVIQCARETASHSDEKINLRIRIRSDQIESNERLISQLNEEQRKFEHELRIMK